ncbi:gamma-glutamylcyclotransferase [Aquicoccus sp.]|uniref:gamma-glutamylcyclotransferase n=1 Tax=Aquicoccus sp. TaxID=2055851 RepID=UPI003566E9B4
MTSIFLYGTLRHAPLLELVSGQSLEFLDPVPARLSGYRVAEVEGQGFPLIEEHHGASCEGVLLRDVRDAVAARLNFYELGFGYDLRDVTVETDSGPVVAMAYFPRPGLWRAGADWRLDKWSGECWPVAKHAAREMMEYFGKCSPGEVADRHDMILVRAGARARAEAHPAPATLRCGIGRECVEKAAAEISHAGFFLMRVYRLRHPLFSGGMSEWISREVFISGDAALVLPYDPVRDRVMLIEQFRMGPYARGDGLPWLLEPIAGRIEAGEGAELTARREAVEEAGLRMGNLERIGAFYASPGNSSEYFNCFVGLTDLPDDAAGHGGAEEEQEDIRSHLLPFDEAITLMESGEANVAPLVLMLLWLQRERPRLRVAATDQPIA